jgi:hypothetical protein
MSRPGMTLNPSTMVPSLEGARLVSECLWR